MEKDKPCPCCKTRDEIIGKLIQVKTMNWISVKDRLPETETSVLTYNNDTLCVCELQSSGSWYAMNNEGSYIWEGGDYTGGIAEQESITHWMPLPEPPKQ